jgi:mRNA interferase RelE/StbE
MYSIEYEKRASEFLKSIDKYAAGKIVDRINTLKENPREKKIEKLKGKIGVFYRIRQGDYRIIFKIVDSILVILVIEIDDRKDIYRK